MRKQKYKEYKRAEYHNHQWLPSHAALNPVPQPPENSTSQQQHPSEKAHKRAGKYQLKYMKNPKLYQITIQQM
jgi:hypothetical protein